MLRSARIVALSGLGLGSGLLMPPGLAQGRAPGAGEGPTIAALPLQVEGEMSQEATGKVQQALLDGLERIGVAVVPPSQLSLGGATPPCNEGAGCIVKVAKANEATHVLEVTVVQSGRDYSLQMILSSGADGSTQAKSTQDCEICGLQELGELIGDQAAALQPKLEAIPATLIVETSPSGATVKVDGKVVGVSPVVEPVSPGEHTIIIAKPGYHERERTVTFVAGGEETVSLGLQPLPVPETGPQEAEPDGKGMRLAGWVLLGVGVGAAGAGVPLLVLDERPAGSRCDIAENIDVNGLCRYRYNTLGGGLGLVAAGGASLVAGAVLLGLGYKRKARGTAGEGQARVLPTGTGVVIRF